MFSAITDGRSGGFDKDAGWQPPQRCRVGALSGAAALVATAALALPAGALAQTNFRAADNVAAFGNNPVAVATGHFNSDSDLDLEIVNDDATSSMWAGHGGGYFTRDVGVGFTDGRRYSAVAVGDLNSEKDSLDDVVIADYEHARVVVELGRSVGGFDRVGEFAVGSQPTSVALGDVNGDGDLDLVVANEGSDNVSVLIGRAGGTFETASNYPVGDGPSSVVVGNWGNPRYGADSHLDLAVANRNSNNVTVLYGTGGSDQRFSSPNTYSVGTAPASLAVGDFDDNSALDLAVANKGSDNVSVLAGGSNGFYSFGSASTFAAGNAPISLAVGDFDADSDEDLAVANSYSDNVSVLFGGSGRSFGSATNYATGSGANSVAVGDLDGDNHADDLVVVNRYADNFSVLLGNRAPTAAGDAYTTDHDTPLDVGAPGVLGNDTDPDAAHFAYVENQKPTAALASGPAHGTVSLNADGSFRYTPEAGYTGADSFSYTVSDGQEGWNVATVAITVK